MCSLRRNLAFDYYCSAHLWYEQQDMDRCEGALRRALDMARRGSQDTARDHLVVQCETFLWLLHVDRKQLQEAAELIQSMVETEASVKAQPGPLQGIVWGWDKAAVLRSEVYEKH